MKKSRVLLLESDWVLATNIVSYFSRLDIEIDWHVDPQSAISSADKFKPDVVILDLILAARSGVEFLYEFRSYPDWQELPVIFYSSVSKKELGDSIVALEQLNVAEYLHKPYTSIAYLAATLNKVLHPSVV